MLRTKYNQYVEHLQKIQDLNSAIALMHWDNEIYAPPKGAKLRGRQIATLAATIHEWSVDPVLEDLINELYAKREQLDEKEAKNVLRSYEELQKEKKLSTQFVKKLSTAKSEALQAWMKAKKAKDYSIFKPALSNLIDLVREKAELIGYEGHPYDALLDEHEKGSTVEQLDKLFGDVRKQLVAFAKEVREQGTPTDNTFLSANFEKDKQWDLGLYLLKQMQYDFDAGRQDISLHPFTVNFSPNDVRVTTRILENKPMEMVGSCIHEGGHALYEQGLKEEYYGLPLGMPTSLGIHESQARIWENNIGLGYPYWQANYPKMQSMFPEQLGDYSLDYFYKAINQLYPDFIRIQADEVHYHLHVLIRYEIEKGLLGGSLEVEGLDKVWNEMYLNYLGLEVPDDALGILQDIHWAEALFGYFPTYSLGSCYAAQFYAQALKDVPNLKESIAEGNMGPLVDWLRENIHQYGQQFTSEELCQRITGEGLNLKYFMDYVRSKYEHIYDLQAKKV